MPRIALPIIAGAFFLQLVELTPLQSSTALMRTGVFGNEASSRLHDVKWSEWVQRKKKHIVLFPPAVCDVDAAPYFPFSLLAADNQMSVNTGYLARYDGVARARYCDALQRDLDAGARDDGTLYIVRHDLVTHFESNSSIAVSCKTADGFTACTTPPAQTH